MQMDCHSEFYCDWEVAYKPQKDVISIAKQMIEEADPCDDVTNFFESDMKMFNFALSEIKKGKTVWIEYLHFFTSMYPLSFNIDNVLKSIEILQASKVKSIIKDLNMNNEEDIMVYQKIIEMRNKILTKNNIIF